MSIVLGHLLHGLNVLKAVGQVLSQGHSESNKRDGGMECLACIRMVQKNMHCVIQSLVKRQGAVLMKSDGRISHVLHVHQVR